MTTKEAFALGFLARMAERGVTPSMLEKRAASGIGGEALEAVGRVLSASIPAALAIGVGLPAATGMLTGSAHAGMADVSREDIKRMKMRDYIDEYRSEARRIRRKLHRDKWRDQEEPDSSEF